MPLQYETTLIVDDLDRSVRFYEDVLELPLTEQRGTRAAFDTGECVLVLEGNLDERRLGAYGLDPPGDAPGRGVIISLEYADVDAVYERVAASEAGEILTELREAHWGERLFLLKDPDGYVFDAAEPI